MTRLFPASFDLTFRTVQVEDQLIKSDVLANAIHPHPRLIHLRNPGYEKHYFLPRNTIRMVTSRVWSFFKVSSDLPLARQRYRLALMTASTSLFPELS